MIRKCAVAAALLLLAPVTLQAQACQGSPAARGSAILVGEVAFTENATSFGPTIGGNFEGPMFASASYAYTDLDGTDNAQHSIGGMVGTELLTEESVSICFSGSASHIWIDDVDIDGQVYHAGASIGYAAPSGGVFVTPHGSVGIVHATANVGSLEGSDTAAQFAGGLSVGSRKVFVGGTVSYATFDGADPVFAFGLGFAL